MQLALLMVLSLSVSAMQRRDTELKERLEAAAVGGTQSTWMGRTAEVFKTYEYNLPRVDRRDLGKISLEKGTIVKVINVENIPEKIEVEIVSIPNVKKKNVAVLRVGGKAEVLRQIISSTLVISPQKPDLGKGAYVTVLEINGEYVEINHDVKLKNGKLVTYTVKKSDLKPLPQRCTIQKPLKYLQLQQQVRGKKDFVIQDFESDYQTLKMAKSIKDLKKQKSTGKWKTYDFKFNWKKCVLVAIDRVKPGHEISQYFKFTGKTKITVSAECSKQASESTEYITIKNLLRPRTGFWSHCGNEQKSVTIVLTKAAVTDLHTRFQGYDQKAVTAKQNITYTDAKAIHDKKIDTDPTISISNAFHTFKENVAFMILKAGFFNKVNKKSPDAKKENMFALAILKAVDQYDSLLPRIHNKIGDKKFKAEAKRELDETNRKAKRIIYTGKDSDSSPEEEKDQPSAFQAQATDFRKAGFI